MEKERGLTVGEVGGLGGGEQKGKKEKRNRDDCNRINNKK